MEKNEILDFLSNEHVVHNKGKLTKINRKSKGSITGHFFKANQRADLIKNNEWILLVDGEEEIIPGNDIASIKDI